MTPIRQILGAQAGLTGLACAPEASREAGKF